MGLEAEAIEKVVSLADARRTVTVDGKTYSAAALRIVRTIDRPDPLRLNSLNGLIEYLENNPDGLDIEKCILHIHKPNEISLQGLITQEDKERDHYLSIILPEELKAHPFGQFMPVEEFTISLRTRFEHTEDRKALLAYIAKISDSNSIEVGDDGITQSVQVKKGLSGAKVENKDVPPIVNLAPYRTFREIEQVRSDFLFRMRTGRDDGVECALFEADGGEWILHAIQKIRDYIVGDMQGTTAPLIIR